jgi:UDP-N-acetylglucosamine 4-epimerase
MTVNPQTQRTWLVTGAAGFIGSHLVERLLSLGQRVIGCDNFATGSAKNVQAVKDAVSPDKAALYTFFEQDIRDRAGTVELIDRHVPQVILHQAALGSVPRSIADPVTSHEANVDGFLNVLDGARLAGVKRFVYASSSSVYGDIGEGAKVEGTIGNPLSPYAATKRIDEVYAQVYGRVYGMETIGLRYFNVFGPRQDPAGPYAAVIPRWLAAMVRKEPIVIFGDGSTSRDFCFVANVVQANILAASVTAPEVLNGVVNVACGATTTLLQLQSMLRVAVAKVMGCDSSEIPEPRHEPFRKGDVPHSLADISLAREKLGYFPTHSVEEGIEELVRAEVELRAL